jgi:hypothetical protein
VEDMTQRFVSVLRQALQSIVEARFYHSERGYQGALAAELATRLTALHIWPGNPIVEEEYQKRLDVHGLRARPDIIIHIPFERGSMADRHQGNLAVIELKRRARREAAFSDFDKLLHICSTLSYPLGIFVNIDAKDTFLQHYDAPHVSRLKAFAVRLVDGLPTIEG